MTIAQRLVAETRRSHPVLGHEALDIYEQGCHAQTVRCGMPHRQGVLCRTYPISAFACDRTHVSNEDEMDRVRAAVQRAMDRKGFKRKPLAKAAGIGETVVRDLLEGRNLDVRVGTLRRLAGPLETSLEELLGAPGVPVTGRVGAGGSVEFVEETGELATVVRPPGITVDLEAAEVVGDSMLPRYSSGDVVYFSRRFDGLLDEYYGEFCIARIASGETYVKLLARGSRPGLVTLRSLNAADMEDVEIQWATPIVFVLPRYARRLTAYYF